MTNPVSEHLEQTRYFAWVKKHRGTHEQLHLVFAIPTAAIAIRQWRPG